MRDTDTSDAVVVTQALNGLVLGTRQQHRLAELHNTTR